VTSPTGGPYSIEWAAPARRALQRIPEEAAAAAVELIYGALADNPYRVGKPLRFELEGLRSARRGDYRVIYRVDDHRKVVLVATIAHRRDVYGLRP
jgi:mRNA interferase RelE/StbE